MHPTLLRDACLTSGVLLLCSAGGVSDSRMPCATSWLPPASSMPQLAGPSSPPAALLQSPLLVQEEVDWEDI